MQKSGGQWRTGWAIAVILLFSAAVAFAAKGPMPKKPLPVPQEKTILIYPPHEMGSVGLAKKSAWAAALITAIARFRIELSSPFRAKTIAEVPLLRDPAIVSGGSDVDAVRIREKIGAAYLLVPKFSLDKKQNSMTCRFEIRGAEDAGVAFSAEAAVYCEQFGYGVDSCLLEVIRWLSGGTVSGDVEFFFKIPALGGNVKLTRKLGEALYDDLYGVGFRVDRQADAYRAFLDGDPSALLCVYECAKAAMAARRPGEAIARYKSLAGIAPEKNRCRLPLARALCWNKEPQSALVYINPVIYSMPVKGAYETLGDALLLLAKTTPALDAYYQERERFGELPSVQEKIAAIAFDAGDFPTAEAEYARLAKADPRHTTARHQEALCVLAQGKTDKAAAIFTKAESAGLATASLYGQLGRRFAEARRYDKALEAYGQLLRGEEKNAAILIEVARIRERTGRDSAAAESYLAAYECDPRAQTACLAKAGDLFVRCNRPSKAADAYARYLYHDRTDVNAAMGLARIMFSRKNYQKVIDLLGTMVCSSASSAEMLRMVAHSYCETGRYAAAVPLLSSLVKMTPGDARVVELAAVAYEKQGALAKAAEMYETLLTLPAAAGHPDFAHHVGTLYERLGQTGRAVYRYETNVKKYPEDPRNYDRCGRLYASMRDWRHAQKYLEPAVEFPQPANDLRKLLAQTYAALGKKNDAIRMYRSYVQLAPNDGGALHALGALFFELRKYDRAIGPLQRAADIQPGNFDTWYMLGVSCVQTADYEGGREAFSRARDLNPKHAGTIELLASCHRSLRRDDDLAATLKQWEAIEPARADIPIERGILYLAENKPGDAVVAFSTAARLLPLDARPHKLLAKCYDKLGDERMRLFHLKEANRFAPDDWDTYSGLGFYYLAKDNRPEAERCLRSVVALNPAYARAHFELGTLLLDRNDTAGALAALERAAAQEPGNPVYLAQFGRAMGMNGDSARAFPAVTAALNRESGDLRVLLFSGYTYSYFNKNEIAERLFLEALARDRGCRPCLVALGDLYRKTARYKQAVAAYIGVWEQGGYREEVALKLGAALSLGEKYGEAKDFLETILVKNGANDEARYLLVAALCELGDVQKARETTTPFYGKNPVLAQLCLGRIHEKAQRWDAAGIAYTAVDRLSPRHPLAIQGMARVQAARGRLDSAAVLFTLARRSDSLDMRLIMGMGALYEKRGCTDSALTCYYDVERKCPDHPRVHAEIARVRSQRGERAAAIAAIQKDIRLHPGETHLYFLLGKEFERAEDYRAAIDAYEQALKRGSGKDIEAFLRIGNIYYQKLLNEKKAKKYYARYIRAGGTNAEALAFMKERE